MRIGNKAPEKCQSTSENKQPPRLPVAIAPVPPVTTDAVEVSGPKTSTTRTSQEARKKHQKNINENRRKTPDLDIGLKNVKAELNKKQVSQTIDVTTAKVISSSESVITIMAAVSRPHATTSTVATTSSKTSVSSAPKPSPRVNSSLTVPAPSQVSQASHANNKDSSADISINGGGSRAHTKKNTSIIKHSSTTGKLQVLKSFVILILFFLFSERFCKAVIMIVIVHHQFLIVF